MTLDKFGRHINSVKLKKHMAAREFLKKSDNENSYDAKMIRLARVGMPTHTYDAVNLLTLVKFILFPIYSSVHNEISPNRPRMNYNKFEELVFEQLTKIGQGGESDSIFEVFFKDLDFVAVPKVKKPRTQ